MLSAELGWGSGGGAQPHDLEITTELKPRVSRMLNQLHHPGAPAPCPSIHIPKHLKNAATRVLHSSTLD